MPSPTDTFYVLREGATQEEEWTLADIAESCRSGELGAEARIFIPDENRWVRADETDLYNGPEDDDAAPLESADEQIAREALEHEYAEALDRIEQSGDSVDAHVDAGSVASELGNKDAARAHFQNALDLHPFHARVAQEVKRRFGAGECRSFRLLERPAPVWDNLADLVNFALARGLVYLAMPAAAFSALLFLRGGGVVVGEVATLWCYLTLSAVAAGKTEPPEWKRVRVDPVHRLVLPGAAMFVVSAQWLTVFWGVACLGMLIEGKRGIGVLSYIGASPVLIIAMTLCALCYLPAVMVLIRPSLRGVLAVLLPWKVVGGMIRMELEYATSLLLLFALAVVLGVLGVVTGSVPVVGKLVWACGVAFATPMAAFVLGRLRARTAHAFESAA